ncbi:Tetrapyrrole methylase [Macleaya cordata]|uniref:Tetrapyrrole methylase n=1 Tax=Macleaya cordata TaxID=56857 RepID=A0A200QE32_MACCD|nr:Tetrapyrrole methylase [Macleaya cordata]
MQTVLLLRIPLVLISSPPARSWQSVRRLPNPLFSAPSSSFNPKHGVSAFSSSTSQEATVENLEPIPEVSSKVGPLKSGLYLVSTPIGNLEDITLRALRVLRSADVILSEDTRHSGKLLQHYNIKTSLLSYHKFNESQREKTILKRLHEGDIVALISDAGTPGISDPGTELAKLCVSENISVIPIPGPSALLSALCASGLSTEEFTFVGFLPKHAGSRRERLLLSSNGTETQIFFVPPHKLHQCLEETSSFFGDLRQCVIAREMTKIHEEFWRGTLGEAKEAFSTHQPKGEITLLLEGKPSSIAEAPSEDQLENELRDLISNGHSLSMAVKLVSEGTSVKRKTIYSLALRKFGKVEAEEVSAVGNAVKLSTDAPKYEFFKMIVAISFYRGFAEYNQSNSEGNLAAGPN